METVAKKERIVTQTADREAGTLTFHVKGLGDLVLNIVSVSAEVREAAMYHGFGARIGDAAALSRGASPQEKRDAMEALVTHYNSGATEWNLTRSGGGGGVSIQDVINAMEQVFGADAAKARVMAQNLATKRGITEKEAYGVIAKTPEVIEALAIIRAARATVRAEDLLAEMEGE